MYDRLCGHGFVDWFVHSCYAKDGVMFTRMAHLAIQKQTRMREICVELSRMQNGDLRDRASRFLVALRLGGPAAV